MKCVVSFSGGADSEEVVKRLRGKYELIAVTLNIGQKEEMKKIEEKAGKLGIKKHFVIDAQEEFFKNHVTPAIMANYAHGDAIQPHAIGRAIIIKYLVKIAKEEKADAIAHGSTGKGNDQIRFENGIRAIAPSMKILAPLKEKDRQRKGFSTDENLYGRLVKKGAISDVCKPIPEEAYAWTVNPKKAIDRRLEVDLIFKNGVLKEVREGIRKYEGMGAFKRLNEVGGSHGVGRMWQIEDKLVGGKRREAYEVPGALMVRNAHKTLEEGVLTREELKFKNQMDLMWSALVYEGKWFSSLRKQIETYIVETQMHVTGNVKMELYKGNCEVICIKGPYLLVGEKKHVDGTCATDFSQDVEAFAKRHHIE